MDKLDYNREYDRDISQLVEDDFEKQYRRSLITDPSKSEPLLDRLKKILSWNPFSFIRKQKGPELQIPPSAMDFRSKWEARQEEFPPETEPPVEKKAVQEDSPPAAEPLLYKYMEEQQEEYPSETEPPIEKKAEQEVPPPATEPPADEETEPEAPPPENEPR